jgi:hypothetical protein
MYSEGLQGRAGFEKTAGNLTHSEPLIILRRTNAAVLKRQFLEQFSYPMEKIALTSFLIRQGTSDFRRGTHPTGLKPAQAADIFSGAAYEER